MHMSSSKYFLGARVPLRAFAGTIGLLFATHAAFAQTPSGGTPPPPPLTRVQEMSEGELAGYIAWLHQAKPTPAERVADAAVRCVAQPYVDKAPMFSHLQTDCVTFVEHALAMGLADSWESYIRLTARLRYADGMIPFQPQDFTVSNYRLAPQNPADELLLLNNRNHFTIAQWLPNNAWCLEDVTKQLGTDPIKPWIPLHHIARPKEYLAKQGLQVDVAPIKVVDAFIPREVVPTLLPEFRSGDVLLVIVGKWENRYCDHMGLIICDSALISENPGLAVQLVHSAPRRVQREPLLRFLRRFPRVQGVKVLRLRSDASAGAATEDATMASRMNVPQPQ